MKFKAYILFMLLSFNQMILVKAQNTDQTKIKLGLVDKSLETAFREIEKICDFRFAYKQAEVDIYQHVSLPLSNRLITSTLDLLLSNTNLGYRLTKNYIVVEQKILKTPFRIRGVVKSADGTAIDGATVFLSNTRKITLTDKNGEFSLDEPDAGSYQLVIKMLGYDHFNLNIQVTRSMMFHITLQENSIALNEVAIQARGFMYNSDRQRYLDDFEKYFIGTSANSGRCKIVNPEVLTITFDKEKQVLEASCDEFLIVENSSLGYRLKYLLNKFRLDYTNLIVSYIGAPYFEEMDGSRAKLKQWDRNREEAYEGSVMHFLRAAFNNTASAEGFQIYRMPQKPIFAGSEGKIVLGNYITSLMDIQTVSSDSILTSQNSNFKSLNFKTDNSLQTTNSGLYVVYTKDKEPASFIASGGQIVFPLDLTQKKGQVSLIRPLAGSVIIDKNGRYPPTGFLFNGYWSWERIADQLPVDYVSRNKAIIKAPITLEVKSETDTPQKANSNGIRNSDQ